MAEAYHIPLSPHNAMGPLQVIAGAHVMLTIPNAYKLEHSLAAIAGYQACLDEPLDFTADYVRLSGRPGLGYDARPRLPARQHRRRLDERRLPSPARAATGALRPGRRRRSRAGAAGGTISAQIRRQGSPP